MERAVTTRNIRYSKRVENAFVVDADNEFLPVPVLGTGKSVGCIFTIIINSFYGSKEVQPSELEYQIVQSWVTDDIIVSRNGNVLTIDVKKDSKWNKGENEYVDVIVSNSEYGKRKVTLTISPAFSNSFEIKTNLSVIPFDRDSKNNIIGARLLKATVCERTVDNVIKDYSRLSETNLTIYYSYNTVSWKIFDANQLSIEITATEAKRWNQIYLELWEGRRNGPDSVMYDKESVPFVVDGKKGDKGDAGTSVNIRGSFDTVEEWEKAKAEGKVEAVEGNAYLVAGDLYVWNGVDWENVGNIQGPAGVSSYVHIAYANRNSNGEIIDFSSNESEGRAFIGTYVDFDPIDQGKDGPWKWSEIKGKDAVSISLSSENISWKEEMEGNAVVGVDVFIGEEKVVYNGIGDNEGFKISYTSSSDLDITLGQNMMGYSVGYTLKKKKGVSINDKLFIEITYRNTVYRRIIYITTSRDGDRGYRGPALRGPQPWEDCAVGYDFQSGAEDEEYKDVVKYGEAYYSCILSHKKSVTNYPQSDEDIAAKYWKQASPMEIIASKIILAEYELVKNLGVQHVSIDGDTGSLIMRDSQGNTVIEMRNGNITCNKGTFSGVEVDGIVKADRGYFRGFIFNGITHITPDNIRDYLTSYTNGGLTFYDFDFEKLSPIISLEGNLFSVIGQIGEVIIRFPSIRNDSIAARDNAWEARGIIGKKVIIYNHSDSEFSTAGLIAVHEGGTKYVPPIIYENSMYAFHCDLRFRNSKEEIYWWYEKGMYNV